jgi:tetratricopeptide (TPR) repeat protein
MQDIQIASGLRGAETLAMRLAKAVYSSFERLGLDREWYPHLLSLYPAVMDRAGQLSQAQLFQCLAYHYMYGGDPLRSQQAIQALMDIATTRIEAPLQEEAGVSLIYRIATLDSQVDAETLARRVVGIAELTDDFALIGRVHGALAYFHQQRHQPAPAFEHAQMAFCYGMVCRNDLLIANGLHYMALAFQVGRQPQRALRYLELATEFNLQLGDSLRLAYLQHTWGTCYYLLGDYDKAESYLRDCVRSLRGRGNYYGWALQMLGLILMRRSAFEQAEHNLAAALAVFEDLRQPYDALSVRHALAHVYWLSGRPAEAVQLGEAVLAELETLQGERRDVLLAELRNDLEKYQAARQLELERIRSQIA